VASRAEEDLIAWEWKQDAFLTRRYQPMNWIIQNWDIIHLWLGVVTFAVVCYLAFLRDD